jgi:hypothetical protein
MSSNLAYSLPSEPSRLPASGEEKHNPWRENPRKIEIVTSRSQRRARPRLAYALVAVGGLLVIFLAQLMLSIALSNGAYTISSLLVENRNLGREQGSLSESLEVAGSTQNLAANAQKLGMVATTVPAFLSLETGVVTGSAVAAPESTADASLISNSLLSGLPLIDDPGTAAVEGVVATETDTGTGAAQAPVAETLGAPSAGVSAPSVASSGTLPSVTTR